MKSFRQAGLIAIGLGLASMTYQAGAQTPVAEPANETGALIDVYAVSALRDPADAAKAEELRARFEALDVNGDAANALPLLEAQIEEAKALYVEGAPWLARMRLKRAGAYFTLARFDEAAIEADLAMAGLEAAGARISDAYGAAMEIKGNVLTQTGQVDEALEMLRDVLAFRLANFPPENSDTGQTYLAVGSVLARQGKYAESLAEVQKATAISEAVLDVDDPGLLDNHLNNLSSLSVLYSYNEMEDEAIEASREAARIASAHLEAGNATLGLVLSNYGFALNGAGQYYEAEQVLRRAVETRRLQFGKDHYKVGLAMTNLASALTYQGYPERAEPVFMEAYRIMKASDEDQTAYAGMILDNAAKAVAVQNRFAEARPRYAEAIELLTESMGADHERTGQAQLTFADTLYQLEDYAVAANVRDAAYASLSVGSSETSEQIFYAETLGMLIAAKSDAGAELAPAKAVMSRMSSVLNQSLFRQKQAVDKATKLRPHFERVMQIALAAGDLDTAFEAAQWMTLSPTAQAVAAQLERSEAGTGEAATRIRAAQTAEREVQAAQTAYAAAIAEGDAEKIATAKEDQTAAIAAFDAAFAMLSEDDTAMDAGNRVRPLTLAEVQAALSPDEALVMPVIGDYQPVVFAVTRQTALAEPAGMDDRQIEAAVARLRNGVQTVDTPFDTETAKALYAALFPPAIETVTADASELVLMPEGALLSLPFALLVTSGNAGETPDEIAASKGWLIQRHALSQLPSLQTLRQPTAASATVTTFLGVGDPVLNGPEAPSSPDARPGPLPSQDTETESVPEPDMDSVDASFLMADAGLAPTEVYFRGGVANLEELRALPRLPNARLELETIAAGFPPEGATLLLGAEATQPALERQDLTGFDLIAFATHGLISGELTGGSEPAIVLTPPQLASADDDGLLTASEIARLNLDADWVVLSACNTAAGARPGAPGLSGLSQAFLFAGARGLMVSHWAVRDDAAARLTVGTVTGAGEGGTRAAALQSAMVSLMADKTVTGGGHPALWAPFVYVGR